MDEKDQEEPEVCKGEHPVTKGGKAEKGLVNSWNRVFGSRSKQGEIQLSSRYLDVVLPPPRQSKKKLEDVVQMSGQAPKAAGQ